MIYIKLIDPKYAVKVCAPVFGSKATAGMVPLNIDIQIVKITTDEDDEEIPAHEPLMLFRARDNAVKMLRYYRELCEQDGCTEFQIRGVDNRIDAFEKFASQYASAMKQPGSTEGM